MDAIDRDILKILAEHETYTARYKELLDDRETQARKIAKMLGNIADHIIAEFNPAYDAFVIRRRDKNGVIGLLQLYGKNVVHPDTFNYSERMIFPRMLTGSRSLF